MEPRFQQPPASEPRGTCAGRCTGRPVRRCGRGIPKGCCRFSLRPLKNAQAGGRWPNRHASATAERWSKTGPGPPGEELCPSRKAHSGRKAVTWGITRGCSAAVWRSARQFLPDRTEVNRGAAVASSGGPWSSAQLSPWCGDRAPPADDAEHQEVRFVQRFAAAGR